jgi:hypothetical protein
MATRESHGDRDGMRIYYPDDDDGDALRRVAEHGARPNCGRSPPQNHRRKADTPTV